MTKGLKMNKGLFSSLSLATLLICNILTISKSVAEEANFKEVYQAYNEASNNNDNQETLRLAQLAFELGKLQFGEMSVDSAKLAMNWAKALTSTSKEGNQIEAHDKLQMQAEGLYEYALKNYREGLANSAVELIDPITRLAEITQDDKYAKELLDEAIDIADKTNNSLVVADVKTIAFNRLSKTTFYNKKVRNYAFDAYDIYAAKLPENAVKRVNATYIVGTLNINMNNNDDAEKHLSEVIKQYKALPYSHPYELSAHALLVSLFEQQGRSEAATEHCVAIGKMTPWDDQQEQTPLFRKSPNYPMSYAKQRKNGWVQIEFTVNENGFVKSPEIIDSQGGRKFEKESIKALSQWRYAPKFVDGKPTSAKSTVRLDFTIS